MCKMILDLQDSALGIVVQLFQLFLQKETWKREFAENWKVRVSGRYVRSQLPSYKPDFLLSVRFAWPVSTMSCDSVYHVL